MLRKATRVAVFTVVLYAVPAHAESCETTLATGHGDIFAELGNTPGPLPYDRIHFEDFEPAFDEGLKASEVRYLSLRNSSEPATFANTIVALESVEDPLEMVNAVFDNYLSMKTDERLNELAKMINPKLTAFRYRILFDDKIFARVSSLYERRASLNLNPEQMTLLEKTYRSFVKNGANLGPADKARLNQISEELSVETQKFRENVTSSVNAYQLLLTNPEEVKGVPERVLKSAADAARAAGHPGGWLVTLQAPSYDPFMQFAENRAVREKLWRAFSRRATDGPADNRLVALKIAQLRREFAKILGYPNFAAYQLDDRMVQSEDNLRSFLDRLGNAYREPAKKDLDAIKELAGFEIKPWDMAYYSQKLQQKKFGFSDEDLRPYFPLDQVIEGAFFAAHRLYGVTFVSRPDLPTWDPSVRSYEVFDRAGKHLSYFYMDPFPRESKRQGAWDSEILSAGMIGSAYRRPQIVNVGNFTAPSGDRPALLSYDEVTTVFHELGHALHGMLTQVKYRSLAGSNVAWDFVELPSQLNEHWALVPEVLDVYARHYQTGERIPAELVAKLKAASRFQAGYIGLRQVMLSQVDLAWYTADVSRLRTADDVERFETDAVASFNLLPREGYLLTSNFQHIFAGGYAAGYYSYKWSEVLECDAFSVFEQNGYFDPATADRFRTHVLEKGGSENAADLYRRFRGCDADPDALLRSQGLL